MKRIGPVVLTVACSAPAAPPRTQVAASPTAPAPAAPAPRAPAEPPASTGASTAEAPGLTASATQGASSAKAATSWVQGIDISHYQPKVDWESVKTSASFVFVKATDSTGVVDPRFSSHWSGAKKAGLPRGAYHFFHPKYDVDKQVANFTQHLKSDPGELHPVVDVEEFKHEYQSFTCDQLVEKLQRFSQGVEKELGRKPMIYTNHQTWQLSFCDHPYFLDHPLWLAQYTNHAKEPKLPPGWKGWLFWQYSESGKVPGIPGAVDQSYFNGSVEDLKALLSASTK
ncbi:glycoside hydrolase family 25 protein [Archangium gephyra]|uniref:glycoside hydrolase family 25 protein n=1 Tax=Archangium gephyra TaxID=48 RepID=UPI0011C1A287|nr:GH25 family lysozyme [Archangium gephyra]